MAWKRSRRSHVLVLAFGGLILAAGCTATSVGGSAAPDATAPTPAASASTSGGGYSRGDYGSDGGEYGGVASKPPAASADAGSETSALAVGSGEAGTFLVGEGGMTLYVFQRDSTNSSACDGDCATNWPPLTVPDDQPPEADAAITGTLTVFTRSDGSHQVAYNGQPLYFFAGDTEPGDTNGQGLNDVWFVAGP